MSSQSADDCGHPVTFGFSNIGPVKNASLDLGRLTVIAGRNNTGKTYIAYTLYGFLKTWRHWRGARDALLSAPPNLPNMTAIADTVRAGGRATTPLNPAQILDHRRQLVAGVASAFSQEHLPRVFSSRRESFRHSRIDVAVAATTVVPESVKVYLGGNPVTITYDADTLVASVASSVPSAGAEQIELQVAAAYFFLLLRDLFPDPFILSAERFGISLFYRELDFTKNQLVDLLQKLGDEGARKSVSPFLIIDRTTSRYALPIKDNIDFTRNIPEMPKEESALADHRLFNDVKELIDGYYSNATDDIRFISKARGKGRSFNIPLHLASSSARGLSDLYFYLRHTAARNQLLIIDEPESHLDTRNQVLFARMLARFVGAGLRVLITTHSDYLVKEINNLIMLSRDFPEKEKVARKLRYNAGEGLAPHLVRAYVAENGGLTECKIGAYGIEMPVFDNTIDDINEAAIELSSRVEEDA